MREIKEIIEWLLKIEALAGNFYKEASKCSEKDERLSNFFLYLADEEARHFQVMEGALEYLKRYAVPSPAIIVDLDTKEKIEGIFERNIELLRADKSGRDNLLHCLAMTEFSEWNHIFMYVLNTIKEERQFMSVAASMHHHITEIENFLESLPEGRDHLHIVKSLPRAWEEQILVIDDDLAIAEFLRKLFSDIGQVETAVNGRDGLAKVKEKYFDVIISDVQMPVMNGIDFYNSASAFDPTIGQRILFFTGSPTQAHTEFFRTNQLRYLIKPAPIREILRKVAEIMPNADKVG
ncbi:MAG: response regulator [Thermodesulfovibrionales bacterium]